MAWLVPSASAISIDNFNERFMRAPPNDPGATLVVSPPWRLQRQTRCHFSYMQANQQ
jgi:hypothetical protein